MIDLRAVGQTALYEALKTAIEMVDVASGEPNATRSVVVITDGQATAGDVRLDELIGMITRDERVVDDWSGFEGEEPMVRGAAVDSETVLGVRLLPSTNNHVQVFFIAIGTDADIDVGRVLSEATRGEYQLTDDNELSALLEDFSKYF